MVEYKAVKRVLVSQLTGKALDWAVHQLELSAGHRRVLFVYPYSEDWGIGGPIIDREDISVCSHTLGGRVARIPPPLFCNIDDHFSHGSTSLIAAMRCYVASKMGDEIEVLEELLQ